MQRRLSAIFAADVVGYSRLMGADETGTLDRLKALRKELVQPAIAGRRGRIVKFMGDGVLAEFPSVVEAVQCAVDIQAAMPAREPGETDDRRIRLRIGINLGDIIVEGTDIYGDGVNVAARLEGIAAPGGICISGTAFDMVEGKMDLAFEDIGPQQVKNIAKPVRAYRLGAGAPEAGPASQAEPEPPSGPQPLALPDKPSIAVLPFDNMSGDPEQGYFADGITEDLITDLSKVSGLFVIARNSSFAYRNADKEGTGPDVREVCRALGVRYALEGSVRKAGARVRITAQLIDGTSGAHLWAERYDGGIEDIFAVQDEVTGRIVAALEVALTAGERARRQDRGKVNPEAYDCLVRARACMYRFDPDAAVEARAKLERALAIDAGMAQAYALLGVLHCVEFTNGWNGAGPGYLDTALELAETACRTDDQEQWAWHALALTNMWLRNLDQAERAGERAIALDPGFAGAYSALGSIRDYAGRHGSAIAALQTALRLDPQYDIALQFLGRAQFSLGRYAEAEATFRRRLIRAPESDMTRIFLVAVYGHTGRPELAAQMWRDLLEINPGSSVDHFLDVLPYADPAWFERFREGLRKGGVAD